MNDSLQTMSVLIVDDTPMNIQILAEALRADYRVRVADTGAKALAVAESEDPPDLVLLDIMMPGMDGHEVCRRMKENPKTKGIPVIFVTALGESEDEARGFDLGAVDYITKPFSLPVVRARVRTHLQLKQRTDMLEELSMIDGLTGVANRRSFDQALDREWRRAARNGAAVAVAMIDIDHFKAFNDNYGHGAGDECLRRVAQALKSVLLRPSDLVARYGGEEFVALLPETDKDGAARMAEALRRAVDSLALPHEHSPVSDHVTVSVGYGTTGASEAVDPNTLVAVADRALYEAKNCGRNRVVKGD
ncbi:MAG: diguanylate cyclase [Deltaproteobacteria bacterium]|nr:diguanylate cyclase [Deltaproteobacteria bacterium]